MEKSRKTQLRITVEILLFTLLLFTVNFFFFPDNAGYMSGPFNPYGALSLLVAAYYGKLYGFLTFLLTLLISMVPVNREIVLREYWKLIWQNRNIQITIELIGVYIFGMIRDSYKSTIDKYKSITRKEIGEKYRYRKEAEALAAVNRELEERVLRQTESVTSLYTQIKALHSQNLTESLNVLLKTVNKFSWAEKASVWRFDQSSLKLVMMANIGWQPEDFNNTILDIDETIEGWSFRNNMIFSIRMLLDYDNLSKMDRKRNILTFPINFSNNSWGVLNIEEMPFTKYNLYVEKILSILVDLAAPEIERAVEYESIVTFDENNPHTNLPAYSQLYTVVEKNIAKAEKGNRYFSIVLIELLNFSELSVKYGEENTYQLLLVLLDKLKELSNNKIDLFHYKESNQIALFYPDIDYDGVSMFCLETLGIINNNTWKIFDDEVNLDAILGYSAFGHQTIPAGELFAVAENLLEMQKV